MTRSLPGPSGRSWLKPGMAKTEATSKAVRGMVFIIYIFCQTFALPRGSKSEIQPIQQIAWDMELVGNQNQSEENHYDAANQTHARRRFLQGTGGPHILAIGGHDDVIVA